MTVRPTQPDDGFWDTFTCQDCGLTAISGNGILCDHCSIPCDLCDNQADERFGPVNACPNCYEEAEKISRRPLCPQCGHGLRLIGTTFKCLGCSYSLPGRYA